MTNETSDEARYALIPDELKKLKQWVLWKYEEVDGKITKVPYTVHAGRAKSNDPATWSSYEAVLKAAEKITDQEGGIGFVFNGEFYCGIDFDGCRDPKTGVVEKWALEWIERLDSYTEVSPSGTGVKIWVRAKWPGDAHNVGMAAKVGGENFGKKKAIEGYDNGRYFTTTGVLFQEPRPIRYAQAEVDALYKAFFEKEKPPQKTESHEESRMEDQEVLQRAEAESSEKFKLLLNGPIDQLIPQYYPSQSEADGAFCFYLARFTHDPEQIDRIFRANKTLYREKWEREDYKNKIVHDAIQIVPLFSKNYTDLWASRFFWERHGEKLRWCDELGGWHFWQGGKWAVDKTDTKIEILARTVVKAMYQAGRDMKDKKLLAFSIQREQGNKFREMIRLLKSEPGIAVSADQFDRDTHLLNFTNCTLELDTMKAREHRPKDMITRQIAFAYDPKADSLPWKRFQMEIFGGDAALVEFKQKALGSALSGVVREECFFLQYGTGLNGKTTEKNVIVHILGDYAIEVEPEILFESKSGDNFMLGERAKLKGVRYAACQEPESRATMTGAMIKKIASRDMMTGKLLFKDAIKFYPSHKLFLSTNLLPKIIEVDRGTRRRMHVIPYKQEFIGDADDKDLESKLKAEGPGIINWMVEGCQKWWKEGYEPLPAAVKDATSEYHEDSDVLGRFIEETCDVSEIRDKEWFVLRRHFQLAQVIWAKRFKTYTFQPHQIAPYMKTHNFERKCSDKKIEGKSEKVWFGIQLKNEWKNEVDSVEKSGDQSATARPY